MHYEGVKDKIILAKVTSRGRPKKLIHCIQEYLRLAQNPTAMKWLITLDFDDETCNNLEFINKIKSILPEAYISFGKSESKIHAINRDIEAYTTCNEWHILLNISDDQRPVTQGYDLLIRNTMPNDLDASLWFGDSWQWRINTMEIQGINYYKRFNHVYHPEYKSFYCDNESTEVAMRLGKLIKTDKVIIKHFHPAAEKTERYDALYERNQAFWDYDKELFNKRKAINFGL